MNVDEAYDGSCEQVFSEGAEFLGKPSNWQLLKEDTSLLRSYNLNPLKYSGNYMHHLI
jgi:hypothetical protein